MLSTHHQRTTLLIQTSNLLDLFVRQAELREKIWAAIRVIILWAITGRRAVLAERQTHHSEKCRK
jgi:hypothetical protein